LGIPTFRLFKYIKYRIRAIDAHSLHSPFLYELYTKVLNSADNEHHAAINALQKSIFRSQEWLTYEDPKTDQLRHEQVGNWAKRVTSSAKFMAFLIRLINHLNVKTVLEAGTAAGVNALSMSRSGASKIISLEGSETIAALAQKTIDQYNSHGIEIISGKVQHTFVKALNQHQPELIFLDADHRSSTIRFYLDAINEMNAQPKCILIHDIYWSKDMHTAWESIVKNSSYNLTIDLFEVGLVFPNQPMQKQHFTIRF
jgi:predicted O-methyltransferase YrrM